MPVFEKPPPKYSAIQIMHMLLDQNINRERVAMQRPLQVKSNSSFVVDITKLDHPDDIKKDMYGRWQHSGSHTDVFRCSFSEDGDVEITKCAPGASGANVYYLRRLHSFHPTNVNFRRLIAVISGKCTAR